MMRNVPKVIICSFTPYIYARLRHIKSVRIPISDITQLRNFLYAEYMDSALTVNIFFAQYVSCGVYRSRSRSRRCKLTDRVYTRETSVDIWPSGLAGCTRRSCYTLERMRCVA